MIVTTTDLKQEYEVKGIVRFYLSGMYAKQQLGRNMRWDETIDHIINEILSKQAEEIGANAIVGLTIQGFPGPGMGTVDTNYLYYGTAVKLKNS